MSDDWQPGDLALCMRDGPWQYRSGPPAGSVWTVESVIVGDKPGDPHHGHTGLFLAGIRAAGPTGAFHSSCFRKIRPHTPDAEDTETIRLLTGKPVKETAA